MKLTYTPHWKFLDCDPHVIYLYNPTIGDMNDSSSFCLSIIVSFSRLCLSLSLFLTINPLGRGVHPFLALSPTHQHLARPTADPLWQEVEELHAEERVAHKNREITITWHWCPSCHCHSGSEGSRTNAPFKVICRYSISSRKRKKDPNPCGLQWLQEKGICDDQSCH